MGKGKGGEGKGVGERKGGDRERELNCRGWTKPGVLLRCHYGTSVSGSLLSVLLPMPFR